MDDQSFPRLPAFSFSALSSWWKGHADATPQGISRVIHLYSNNHPLAQTTCALAFTIKRVSSLLQFKNMNQLLKQLIKSYESLIKDTDKNIISNMQVLRNPIFVLVRCLI